MAGAMKKLWIALAVVCALVIGAYAYMSESGLPELLSPNAASVYYNLLVQGFRAGQLNLKKEVPPGLAQLADPYDPSANAVYRSARYQLHDLSYYKGRLYLYFGVTPALILFWPFVELTGHYLLHRQAVLIFCSVGFLASVGLLCGLRRRYFAEVSVGVVAACALALGLATGLPVLLSRSEVYEVQISCAYMLTMLAFGAIWRASHETEQRRRWLAAASLSYGLAVGARPSLLFGAIILLLPVLQEWQRQRKFLKPLLAATVPILLIGWGLMLYNAQRFGSPFEFGMHYALAPSRLITAKLFNPQYLWFNFRLYFLQPARWSGHFPFVQAAIPPSLPSGYMQAESPFGLLMNIPLVWLALAVPLAWQRQSASTGSALRWFVAAVALQSSIGALTLGAFFASSMRYEVDFLPALVLLAAVGIFGLEQALADQPPQRRAVRCVWGLLLAFSVTFNLLLSVEYHAEIHNLFGFELLQAGKISEAVGQFQRALRIKPDYADAHLKLGIALQQTGRVPEAIEQYQQALRLDPDQADAHYNLGLALAGAGRTPEAMEHWEQAVRLLPDFAEAHYNLGVALQQAGKIKEASAHFEQALRIKPNFAEARDALTRLQAGQ
jgi:Tfp pilus assembly protein PilF